MTTVEAEGSVEMSQVQMEGETYFRISNSDAMRPFFMSIVSDSNHWMFISSNGGLTAGRKNAEYALFPYYTDDKITESAEITGSKALFWVRRGKEALLWGRKLRVAAVEGEPYPAILALDTVQPLGFLLQCF